MEEGLAAHLKVPSSWQGTKKRGSWGKAAALVTLVIIWFPSPRDAVEKFGAGQQREAIQWSGGESFLCTLPSLVLKGLGSHFPGRWVIHKPKVCQLGKLFSPLLQGTLWEAASQVIVM